MTQITEANTIQSTRVPEVGLCIQIMRAAEALAADFAPLFKQYGLTHQQYNVLRILRGAGERGLPILDIGERMINRLPDMTRLIDRMEKMNWVARRRCTEDRRVVWVQLTNEGRRLLEKLDQPVLELHKKQFEHCSKAELKQLSGLLDKAISKR